MEASDVVLILLGVGTVAGAGIAIAYVVARPSVPQQASAPQPIQSIMRNGIARGLLGPIIQPVSPAPSAVAAQMTSQDGLYAAYATAAGTAVAGIAKAIGDATVASYSDPQANASLGTSAAVASVGDPLQDPLSQGIDVTDPSFTY